MHLSLQQFMLCLTLPLLAGCTYYAPLPDWNDGDLIMQAQFPAAIQTQAIPEGTQYIEIRVSGEGIPKGAILSARLTPTQTQVTFTGVPVGSKSVAVKAFDSEGAILATGTSEVGIVPGATVATRVRLNLLNDSGQFHLILE